MKIAVIILLSFFSAILFLMNLPFFAIATIALPFFILILSRKMEYGLYFVAIWVPMQYFFSQYYLGILPQNFVWIDEALIFCMFFVTVAEITIQGKKPRWTSIDLFVFLFFISGAISAFVNLINPVVALLGIRAFLQYYLLYFVIKNNKFKEQTFKTLLKIISISFLIQIPIGILQFITWKPAHINPLTGGSVNSFDLSLYDAVVGTFGKGAANNFGYLLVMVILLILAWYIHTKKKVILISILLFLIPLVLSESKGAYFILAISLLYTFRANLSKASLSFALIVIVFIITINFYFSFSGFNQRNSLNFKQMVNDQLEISPVKSGRLIGIKIGNDLLLNKAPSFLIGLGPGMFSSSTGIFFSSKPFIDVANKMRSARAIAENDFVPMMVEFGYLGLFFFICIIFSMSALNRRIYSSTKYKNLKALSLGGSGVIFVFLVSAILIKVWEVQYIAFYIWLYMAYIEIQYQKEWSLNAEGFGNHTC